jgi:hypothetical protein
MLSAHFESFAAKHSMQIKHYHCNNGHFTDNKFCMACEAQQQSSPSAGSMPTSRMVSLSKPSETSQKRQRSNSFMLASTGHRL